MVSMLILLKIIKIKIIFPIKYIMTKNLELDENAQLVLLLKFILTVKNIKKQNLKMKELTIELDNLNIELNHIKESLTSTKLNDNQILSLDEDYNVQISRLKDSEIA